MLHNVFMWQTVLALLAAVLLHISVHCCRTVSTRIIIIDTENMPWETDRSDPGLQSIKLYINVQHLWKKSLEILYIFLNVNNSQEKSKTMNHELIQLTDINCLTKTCCRLFLCAIELHWFPTKKDHVQTCVKKMQPCHLFDSPAAQWGVPNQALHLLQHKIWHSTTLASQMCATAHSWWITL